jgi:catechol 2,3-dioxygenase-like lactoylglutathione lyase family enzyme
VQWQRRREDLNGGGVRHGREIFSRRFGFPNAFAPVFARRATISSVTPIARASRLNHVSVSAPDIEASARFYTELFGLEEIPAPDFGYPVRWFRAGDLQLHLFRADVPAPQRHHFALSLSAADFCSVYVRAKREGFLDGRGVRRLPDGCAQAYVRDPAGNMIEINAPSADSLDTAIVGELTRVSGPPDARLYL